MEIQFKAIGLTFQATVHYTPYSAGTYWEPPELEEVEILTLEVGGKDAMFLLTSKVEEEIITAAEIAVGEELEWRKREQGEDLAASRADFAYLD